MTSRQLRALMVLAGILVMLPAAPATAQRLHAIVVADTVSPGIGMPVSRSVDALVTALEESIPADKLSLTLLTGDKYSRAQVLDAVRAVEPGEDDAILYYFCGHGFYDSRRGTLFKPPGEDRELYLSEIRKPLREKRPRLLVTICDCCSGRVQRATFAPAPRETVRPDEVSAICRKLFWQSSGNLVINSSSPGQYATVRLSGGTPSEPGMGALFTNVFVGSLKKHRDDAENWDTILRECRASVDREFRKLHPDGTIRLGDNRVVNQATQTVWGLKNDQVWFRPAGQ